MFTFIVAVVFDKRMNAQQLKVKLKEARDAVNSNDMQTAIRLCREILEVDQDHYMAHLLIAKAYQDTNQATAAIYLRRAVALTTDPIIPYQGLAKCVKPEELADVLFEILKLQPDKYEEYYGRIAECGKKLTDPDPCLEVIQKILDGLDPSGDEEKRKLLFATLSELFLKQKEIPDKWKKLYAESLWRSIKRSHVDQHENYRRCIKLFSELKCNVELLTVCCDMFNSFKNDAYPLEWICKVYTENMKTKEIPNIKEVLKKDIREYVEALYALNPKSILGLVTKGMHHFDSGEFFEALDIFTAVNEIKPNWSTCLRMLAQVYQKFRAFDLAEKSAMDLNVKDTNLVRCMFYCGKKLEETERLIEEVLNSCPEADKPELFYYKAGIKLLQGKGDIKENLKEMAEKDDYWTLKTKVLEMSLLGKFQDALELISKSSVDLSSDDLVKRGQLEYKLQKPGFLLSFMNALKKDLCNSDAFYWLARVYFEDGDHLRSIKCVEKCLRMNPLNEEALKILQSLSHKSEDNDKLYKEILDEAVRHGLDLGLFVPLKLLAEYHEHHKDINEAAIYYRKALRLNPKDYDCWLSLGTIQFENSSFSAAEKLFQKICQLFPKHSGFAKLKLAVIKTKMNLFEDAETAFENLIAEDASSVEVFREYAQAHLLRAETKKNQRLFGRSKDHTQKGIDLLCRAHILKSSDREIKILLGKALNFAANLPAPLCSLELPSFIVTDGGQAGQGLVTLRNENLFVLANKYLDASLHDPNNSATPTQSNDQLYYLMAENSFQRYTLWSSQTENGAESLQSAVSCIKLAIGLNPNRWEFWNLYGLLLSTDEVGEPTVAEEIFNMALEVNKSSFTVWANLGTLYLKCNEVSAANRAFGKAQENEISYENGWLGQAMIADRLAVEDEAMGLYRHCLELDYHRLAAVGYAKWVTHRLDQVHVKKYKFAIENMYAVPMALDAIGWYMKEMDVKASVKSLCYLGYLSFHKENFQLAADAYLKATEKAEGDELDDILFNLGYIYLLLDRPEQAVKVFKHIKRISFEAQIGLAVAHFYAKDYKVTYAIYETALDSLAQTDEQRIEILTAMAALVYEFQGEDDAKMILMQCVTLNNPIKGLLNVCALYLLHNDLQTAELAVKELRAYENHLEYFPDVAFLISVYYVKKKQHEKAVNYILSMIHKFPTNAKLRTIYVDLILKSPFKDQRSLLMSGRIAESALALTHSELLKCNSKELSKALALISVTKEGINAKEQRIYAQKAVFVNPENKAARKALEMYISESAQIIT